jgi:hypothetical protein
MRYLLLITSILISCWASAQNIAAFSDYQKKFVVFDNGSFRQLEFQPVLSYQIGDRCIGYLTNANTLKAYYNHIDYELSTMVDAYNVTDNLIAYKLADQLYVFEGGKKTLLSRYVGYFEANDSIIAFFDVEKYYLQAYYNGKVHTLEDGLLYDNTKAFEVGNNMMAYVDAFENFKVFYQGKVHHIMQINLPVDVKLGRNIMAFIDPVTDMLQVFYNHQLSSLEPFKPKAFQVGYEKVAYIDNTETFKLFDNGEIYTISSFAPDKFLLKDNILAYEQLGQLYVFYKGKSVRVENYIPASYQISDNAIVWVDMNGNLKLIEEGNLTTLTYERVNEYKVLRNVIIYNQGVNTTKVYYKGKTYEY